MHKKTEENAFVEIRTEINTLDLFQFVEDEHIAKQEYFKMETALLEAQHGTVLFMFPGLEGMHTSLKPLSHQLRSHNWCLQYSCGNPKETVQELAQSLIPVKMKKKHHI